MVEGGCACGFVRYRLTTAPIFVNCCHCRDCQRASGSAFAINAMIEADRVVLVGDGEPEVAPAPADAHANQSVARCPHCGTALWTTHRLFGPPIRFVFVGTLDAAESLPPDAHFFTRSRHNWITIPEGAAAFDTLPGPDESLFDAKARSRVEAALDRR